MHSSSRVDNTNQQRKAVHIGDGNRQKVCANGDDSRLFCSLLFIFIADRTKLQQGVTSVESRSAKRESNWWDIHRYMRLFDVMTVNEENTKITKTAAFLGFFHSLSSKQDETTECVSNKSIDQKMKEEGKLVTYGKRQVLQKQ